MKFKRRESLFASEPEDHFDDDAGLDSEPPRQLAAPRPVAPARSSGRAELNAFLGRGCTYEGKLTFEGRVRIDGKFSGEIFSNDTLEVGPDAEIEAEIDVNMLVLAGNMVGNITARGRCDLRAPAVVRGNITAPIVTMEEGVRFDGKLAMSKRIEDEVRAPTRRSTAPEDPETSTVKPTVTAPRSVGTGSGRRAAPRNPSDLLTSVP